jgi:hypothetical protein
MDLMNLPNLSNLLQNMRADDGTIVAPGCSGMQEG